MRIDSGIRQVDYPPHDHEFAELCLVASGRGLHRTEHGVRPLRAGSMVVVMPGQVHAFEKTERLRTTNVYYLSEWLMGDFIGMSEVGGLLELFLFQSLYRRPAWKEIPQFALDPDELASVSRDLADFEDELKQPQPSQFYLRATFLRFLFRSARAFRRTTSLPPTEFPPDVRLLLDRIEDALAKRQPLSVEKVLDHLPVSPRQAARKFKAFVGVSVINYFQWRRVDVACHLLLDPSHSITEIAHELGFADGAHFSRSFRAVKKMHPREFRRIYLW